MGCDAAVDDTSCLFLFLFFFTDSDIPVWRHTQVVSGGEITCMAATFVLGIVPD